MSVAPEYVISYHPRGAARDIFALRVPELVVSGPAGTGKSRAILEKLHLIALKHPGVRLLMVRKTRRSLTESGMVTYWQKIRPDLDGVKWKPSLQQYQYPNGSILAVGGLDKPSKIMSSEWDVIYVQESTELTETDWEACTIRLRNGKMPYQQLIGDCNPDAPTHWLKQRASAGKTLMIESRHEDNPLLFTDNGAITPEGERYIGSLEALSGVRLARYRYGIWAAAEGTVYEDSWDRARNVIAPIPIPASWPRYLAIDFGFTHPFVCLWAAQDDDGRLIIYRQIYKTKTLVEDHAKEIKRVSRWGQPNGDPLPRAIICDHDAEGRRTLERHLGLNTIPAQKNVSEGIQAVASRFLPAGDGEPRLKIFRDSVVERDRDLVEQKQPTCLEEEPDTYIWDTRQGLKRGEQPVKESDHACLVAGTMITTRRGDVPIEQIAADEYVLTRNGYKRVIAAGMTNKNAEVFTVHLSDGRTLTGTGNHPVYRNEQEYIPLHSLRYGDKMLTAQQYERPSTWNTNRGNRKSSFTRALSLDVTLNRLIGPVAIIIAQMPVTSRKACAPFIAKYGKMRMGLFLLGLRSIIRMATHSITISRIWNALQKRSINHDMKSMRSRHVCDSCENMSHQKYRKLQKHGISQKRVGNGIRPLVDWHTRMRSIKHILVSNVGKSFNHAIYDLSMLAFAPIIAKHHSGVIQALTMNNVYASNAEANLSGINMPRRIFAQGHVLPSIAIQTQERKRSSVLSATKSSQLLNQRIGNAVQKDAQIPFVVSVEKESVRRDVYNLTVENPEGEGEYFANGVLVHNCDALRYLVAHFDLLPSTVRYSNRIY